MNANKVIPENLVAVQKQKQILQIGKQRNSLNFVDVP